VEFAILLAGLVGMFRGIEISHPVFAALFCDLAVAFAMTAANLLSLASASYKESIL
jgi:hypothetical protein